MGKRNLFIIIRLGMTSFPFSNCTEELGLHLVLLNSLKIRMTSYPCDKQEQITLSHLLSIKYSMMSNRQGNTKLEYNGSFRALLPMLVSASNMKQTLLLLKQADLRMIA